MLTSIGLIKDECKLELQTPEIMKLFSNTKELINKTKIEKKYLKKLK